MKAMLWFALMALVPLGSATAAERFACNAKALSQPERARYQALTQRLVAAVQENRELPNGYGFRLPPGELIAAAEWVALERRCCPFFTFTLEQARDGGPLWLHITGTEGVKAFIREELQF